MIRVSAAVCLCVLLASPAAAQEAPAASPMPSFGSLFRGLGADLTHLVSRETATILGVGGAAALALSPRDRQWSTSAIGSEGLGTALGPGGVLGTGTVQAGGALATYIAGRLTHSPRTATIGAELVRAQMLNGGLTQGLKYGIRRRRPDSGRYSFPSGHSSASFATAAVLQRELGWKAGLPAYGAAAYVGLSRIADSRHFPSDVAFGAALGIVAGRSVTVGRGNTRFALSPIASSERYGVEVTLISAP